MGGQVEENVTVESSENNQIKFPVVTQNNNLGAKKKKDNREFFF